MDEEQLLKKTDESAEKEPVWSNRNVCQFFSCFDRRPMMTKWVCSIEEQENMKFSIWEKLRDTFDMKAVKFFAFTEKDKVYVYPLIETYEGERCLITEAEDKYYMYGVSLSQDLHTLPVIALQNCNLMSNIWYIVSFFSGYVPLFFIESGNVRRLCTIVLSGIICQLIQYYMTYKYFCVRQRCCSEGICNVRHFFGEYIWAKETRDQFWLILFFMMVLIYMSVSFLVLESGILQRLAVLLIVFFTSFSFAFDLVIEYENMRQDEKGEQERKNRRFIQFFASFCFLLAWIIVIDFVIPVTFSRFLFMPIIDIMPAFIQEVSEFLFFGNIFFILKVILFFGLPPALAGKAAQLIYSFVRRRRKRLLRQVGNHANDLH